MNAVSAMLVAYACIAPLEPAPDLNVTFAYKCAPVQTVAAKPAPIQAKPQVKRKVASRCDGTAKECRMSRPVCGREQNDWYTRKDGRRKFHCRRT